MMIAHIPAAYLVTRRMIRFRALVSKRTGCLLALGLLASVLPDIDLLYFYLIDNRQTLHHEYWTHVPAFWVAVMLFIAGYFRLARVPIPRAAFAVFFANIFLHMSLDTLAGGILWLYPWDLTSFALVEVPARYGWWVWNFVLHWSFLFEIAIVAVFVARLRRDNVLRGLRNRLRPLAAGRILPAHSPGDEDRP